MDKGRGRGLLAAKGILSRVIGLSDRQCAQEQAVHQVRWWRSKRFIVIWRRRLSKVKSKADKGSSVPASIFISGHDRRSPIGLLEIRARVVPRTSCGDSIAELEVFGSPW